MPPAFAPLFAGVVGKPGWHAYLAYDGDVPVATAGMYVTHDVAWLVMGSTLPTHRRRGAQGALLARRVEDGRALGCRRFVTETGADDADAPQGVAAQHAPRRLRGGVLPDELLAAIGSLTRGGRPARMPRR